MTRAREAGLLIGGLPTGPHNAITDGVDSRRRGTSAKFRMRLERACHCASL